MTAIAPEPASAHHLEKPRVSPGVTVHEPAEEGGQWVLQRGKHYYRVGADAARLAKALDGSRDSTALASHLGWPEVAVTEGVSRFDKLNLIDDGTAAAPSAAPLINFVPPLTIQFTLVRPAALMDRLHPLIRVSANRYTAALALLVSVGGLLALAAQSADLGRALSSPLPPAVYASVIAAFLISTSLHEMGHAATLNYYGGRPSRMGVMLFYLTPAFFCDVSDGWRLNHRYQRVRVAMAGVATQMIIAGGASIAALFVTSPGVQNGVLVFALVSYVAGILNFLPFVKLDGYIALMSHLDRPFLRDRAMSDARRWFARTLFGGRYEREIPRPWSVPFGLACIGFPVYLIITALALWTDLLQRSGLFGFVLMALAVVYMLYLLLRGVHRLAGEVRRSGASRLRVVTATALFTGACAAALFTPVSHSLSGGYVTHGDQVLLVFLPGSDTSSVEPGQDVELVSGGLVLQPRTGSATVDTAAPEEVQAPLSAFAPVVFAEDPELPAEGYPITVDGTPEQPVGAARVDAGTIPLWEYAYVNYLAPFLP
ncbi:daptide biosynthesis intramembrane metalloprotease [Nocardiopsis metallicus]|uniref:Putative peptide zinc metalloprotease protein n=1 Tax=Nocardiopsis metallicus TaxID=179819 RepID=A0A840WP12_9ACTN|nr:daptide biosynthesis intramembrane metalloprotease [Nocardiopsis metallicus]MBB5493535.1 putative peptide zinc metalloprotease protein [Nocardiopsis metallicus]